MSSYDLSVNIPSASSLEAGDILNCPFTGSYIQVVLPIGIYKLECWGAQGGYLSTVKYGGKGGYSYGTLTLEEQTNVFLYTGGAGTTVSKGFNGGGTMGAVFDYSYSNSTYTETTAFDEGTFYGGGASDIRLRSTDPENRVIIAGGGGCQSLYIDYPGGTYMTGDAGGAGGGGLLPGISSNPTASSSTYGTIGQGLGGGKSVYSQVNYAYGTITTATYDNSGLTENTNTNRGTLGESDSYNGFGIGGNGVSCADVAAKVFYTGGAGGGGLFGGMGGYPSTATGYRCFGGGGGSGYVFWTDEVSSSSDYRMPGLMETDVLDSWGGLCGTSSFNDPDGTIVTGHSGDGYVRITIQSLDIEDVFGEGILKWKIDNSEYSYYLHSGTNTAGSLVIKKDDSTNISFPLASASTDQYSLYTKTASNNLRIKTSESSTLRLGTAVSSQVTYSSTFKKYSANTTEYGLKASTSGHIDNVSYYTRSSHIDGITNMTRTLSSSRYYLTFQTYTTFYYGSLNPGVSTYVVYNYTSYYYPIRTNTYNYLSTHSVHPLINGYGQKSFFYSSNSLVYITNYSWENATAITDNNYYSTVNDSLVVSSSHRSLTRTGCVMGYHAQDLHASLFTARVIPAGRAMSFSQRMAANVKGPSYAGISYSSVYFTNSAADATPFAITRLTNFRPIINASTGSTQTSYGSLFPGYGYGTMGITNDTQSSTLYKIFSSTIKTTAHINNISVNYMTLASKNADYITNKYLMYTSTHSLIATATASSYQASAAQGGATSNFKTWYQYSSNSSISNMFYNLTGTNITSFRTRVGRTNGGRWTATKMKYTESNSYWFTISDSGRISSGATQAFSITEGVSSSLACQQWTLTFNQWAYLIYYTSSIYSYAYTDSTYVAGSVYQQSSNKVTFNTSTLQSQRSSKWKARNYRYDT